MEILGIIGHILLIILFVVLGLIACLVIFPFVYRARVVRPEEGELSAKGLIRWLFGFLWISFEYGKDGFSWELRIIGIPVRRILAAARERKRGKDGNPEVYEGPVRAKKQPTIRPGERPVFKDQEPEPHHIDTENRRYFKDDTVFGAPPKTPLSEKIALTFRKLCDIMKMLGTGGRALKKAWPFLMKLLKHIRPRKIEGTVAFGLDDPANTGMVLGLLDSIYPFLPEKLEILPDFQEKRFNCDLFAGGHLFLVYVIVYAVKIIRIEEIRELIKIINVRRRKNG